MNSFIPFFFSYYLIGRAKIFIFTQDWAEITDTWPVPENSSLHRPLARSMHGTAKVCGLWNNGTSIKIFGKSKC